MYRMNSFTQRLNPRTRMALALLAICLIASAAPCIGPDADGPCDHCDQDDLIVSPAAPFPVVSRLLVERPGSLSVISPASLSSRFPHPPIL